MANLDNLVTIDTETSGTNPFSHQVLSIALLPLKEEIPPLEIYVKYEKIEWTDYALKNFDKFSSKWAQHGIPPALAIDKIEKYIKDNFKDNQITLVGHNVGFDISFLRKLSFLSGKDMIKGISHRSIDTHSILNYLQLTNRTSIEDISSDGAFEYFNIPIPQQDRHTAMGDAIATKILINHLIAKKL